MKNINGVRINIRENPNRTSKKSIFLVHGWGGSLKSLTELHELLMKEYSVYSIELPGFGGSDLPGENWGVPEYAEIVGKYISNIRSDEKIYIGHSFGGGLGVYLAATNPKLFNKLVLCGAAVYRSPKVSKSISILKKLPFYENIKAKAGGLRKVYHRVVLRKSDAFKHPLVEKNYRKILTQDLGEYALKVKKPTLILWGDKDSYTPLSDGIRLSKNIKKAKFNVYEGFGHGLVISNPELVLADLSSFLEN